MLNLETAFVAEMVIKPQRLEKFLSVCANQYLMYFLFDSVFPLLLLLSFVCIWLLRLSVLEMFSNKLDPSVVWVLQL